MNKKYSLISILQITNLIILFFSWYIYIENGGNDYVNFWSIVLNSILIVETIFFLGYSKNNKNQLLFILSFLLTFFYSFRILTLAYNPFSLVLIRFDCTWEDINYALTFIIITSFGMFYGIHRSCNTHNYTTIAIYKSSEKNFKPFNSIIILASTLLLTFANNLEGSIFTIITGYISAFFLNTLYLFLSCFVFFLYFYRKLNNITILIFFFFSIVLVLGQALSGSRSAILSFVMIILFGILSYNGIVFLKLKHLLLSSILIPVSIIFFILSTHLRQSNSTNIPLNEKIEFLSSYITENNFDIDNSMKIFLGPVFDRIGYLDYATELIAQKEIYKSIFNIQYYFKSIIDNVLTPGFNLFDTPKASNALSYVYWNQGKPSLRLVTLDNYQSDEFTIFGELYNLFGGWISFVAFIIIGYYFQNIMFVKCSNEFIFILKNAFVINAFYNLINSFGLDWFSFNILSFVTTFFVFIYLLKIRLLTKYNSDIHKTSMTLKV